MRQPAELLAKTLSDWKMLANVVISVLRVAC